MYLFDAVPVAKVDGRGYKLHLQVFRLLSNLGPQFGRFLWGEISLPTPVNKSQSKRGPGMRGSVIGLRIGLAQLTFQP